MRVYNLISGIYSIAIPDGYLIEEDENTIGIYNEEDGVGTINITAYVIPASYDFVIEDELLDFVLSNKGVTKSTAFFIKEMESDYRGCEFVTADDRYWRYWLLYRNHKAVFCTYNCSVEDCSVEIDIIQSIIESIKVH